MDIFEQIGKYTSAFFNTVNPLVSGAGGLYQNWRSSFGMTDQFGVNPGFQQTVYPSQTTTPWGLILIAAIVLVMLGRR
jgi:hypothetical protein